MMGTNFCQTTALALPIILWVSRNMENSAFKTQSDLKCTPTLTTQNDHHTSVGDQMIVHCLFRTQPTTQPRVLWHKLCALLKTDTQRIFPPFRPPPPPQPPPPPTPCSACTTQKEHQKVEQKHHHSVAWKTRVSRKASLQQMHNRVILTITGCIWELTRQRV